MLLLAAFIFLVGVAFSAFFSGTETAYYRASRVKIVMSALEGDRISKFLVWLTNHPAFFVGTVLIGNNIANYVASFSIVMAATLLFSGYGGSAEMVATILVTPFLFVFGEALPKSLCYRSPNSLLRLGAFPLLIISILLAPISGTLWGLARILEQILGQSPERLQLALARKELQQVLDEGQQAGILHPTQRQLSQNFFLVAGKPIRQVCLPINRLVSIKWNSTRQAAIRHAQRHGLHDLPVSSDNNELIGYYQLIDLLVMPPSEKKLPQPKPLKEIGGDEPFGEAILWMQTHRETLVKVVDKQKQVIGILAMDQLTSQLLRGPLESLRR